MIAALVMALFSPWPWLVLGVLSIAVAAWGWWPLRHRDAPAQPDPDEPVPYWPARPVPLADLPAVLDCDRCIRQAGECTCPSRCNIPGCPRQWTTTLSVFTAAEEAEWRELLKEFGK